MWAQGVRGQRGKAAGSHISPKTSEIWGTRRFVSWGGGNVVCLPPPGLEALIGRRTVDCRDFLIEETQIDRQLTSMMRHMGHRSVGDHGVTRPFADYFAVHAEAPHLHQVVFCRVLERLAGL